MKKKWCSIFMVVWIGGLGLWTSDLGAYETQSFYEINPPYAHLKNRTDLRTYSQKKSDRSVTTDICYSETEFQQQLSSNYQQRNTSFQLRLVWDFLFSDLSTIWSDANNNVKKTDDYTYFSIYSRGWQASGSQGDVTMTITIVYWTSYAQEEAVDQRVTEILGQIIQAGMNEEEKQKAIHDWIVLNVQYDQSLVSHSSYDALFGDKETVCQGYALLAYKMLTESSLNARIVDGTAGGGNHAWNLVRVCSNWYHMDATWDDPVLTSPDPTYIRWDYLYLSDDEIDADHSWDVDDPANWPTAPLTFETGRCNLATPSPFSAIQLLLLE